MMIPYFSSHNKIIDDEPGAISLELLVLGNILIEINYKSKEKHLLNGSCMKNANHDVFVSA